MSWLKLYRNKNEYFWILQRNKVAVGEMDNKIAGYKDEKHFFSFFPNQSWIKFTSTISINTGLQASLHLN